MQHLQCFTAIVSQYFKFKLQKDDNFYLVQAVLK